MTLIVGSNDLYYHSLLLYLYVYLIPTIMGIVFDNINDNNDTNSGISYYY